MSNSKFFYIAERKSNKYIVKSEVNNKLFKDNAVILHCYPNKDGFLVYLHENGLTLADKSMKDNPRFVKKAKNEHFAKRFTLKVDRTKCKNPEQTQKADAKALNDYIAELEKRATALKQKADADAKADAEKQKANKQKADAKASESKQKAKAEKQPA